MNLRSRSDAAEAPLRGRRSARRQRLVAAVALLAGVSLVAACGSSGSSSTVGGSGGSGSSYFKGKTITLIAPDSPGGSYDLYARLFAPYLGSALGATINVENINGGGTLDGTNQMAAASPNGLTLGLVNVGGDTASLVEHQPGENFKLSTLSWIGQPAVVPNVMITQPGSGLTSFSSLLHSSNSVPVLDIRSGVGDLLNRVVLGAFHIPNHLLTGFNETSALKQGFLAKDGKVIFEAATTLYPLIAGNEAKPLLVTASSSLPSYKKVLGSTPTLSSELSHTHLSSSNSAAVKEAVLLSNLSDDFAGPPGISASHLAVLRAAFAKVASSAALKAKAQKESLVLGPTSGPALSTQVRSALTQGKTITPYVNAKG